MLDFGSFVTMELYNAREVTLETEMRLLDLEV